jgi:glycosidase
MGRSIHVRRKTFFQTSKQYISISGGHHFKKNPLTYNSYFLLPDRFSDAHETNYVDNAGNHVTASGTPLYTSTDNGDAVTNTTDRKAWLDAGAKFCGGSIKGIASKLGYLKRLGATAVWVGPMFRQVAKLETYHGYGVQNVLDVDPRFGTRKDLKEMVAEAHALGMYVIMDIIL